MKKKRIKYRIGLNNQNGYYVEYDILSKDYNNFSELLKVWIFHFYRIIYNYGNQSDENVIALFGFLFDIKSLDIKESLNNMIENKYGKFYLINFNECDVSISGEIFDINNRECGINVMFPLSVNCSDINASVLVLSLFIWNQLKSHDAKELFFEIVGEVFDTRNDLLLYSLQGNLIIPNRLIEKYSDRMQSVSIVNLTSVKETVVSSTNVAKQTHWKVSENNYITNELVKRKGSRSMVFGFFYGFILGVILTIVITISYPNIVEGIFDDKPKETYINNGKIYLTEDMLSEVKAEAHILDWGRAIFKIYNGTEYSIESVVIEISVYNEKGEVVEARKYKEDKFLRIDSYTTDSIEFDTGIIGIGQVSDEDSHIPEHLVSWKFVEIIVSND